MTIRVSDPFPLKVQASPGAVSARADVVGPAGRDGLPGVNGVENDTAVAAYVTNGGSATRAALASEFVEHTDLVPVPATGHKFKWDTVAVATAGATTIQLGADPVAGSVMVWLNNVIQVPSTYTVTGRDVELTTASPSSVVLIHYAYPNDQTATNAAIDAGPVTLLSDQFNRTASATSLGNADTGQTWTSLRGTWGIATGGATAYLATPSSTSSTTNDAVTVDLDLTGYGTLTIEYRASATSTANGPGIAMFMGDADNGIITNNTGFFTRTTASGTVRQDTWSQTILAGDTVRFVINLSTRTYAAFRQVASAGSFVSINTPVAIAQNSGAKFGLRERSVNTARWDWVTMVAS